jgi:16S rRNA (cytosine1402-N4)-methyltransferase
MQQTVIIKSRILLFMGKVEQDFFGNVQTPFRAVNNKVIVPSDEEIARNPRSRSAKLRIAEKK